MIEFENDIRNNTLKSVAHQMAVAARTAPKARGIDHLEIAIISGKEQQDLASVMRTISEERGMAFFNRDADNILQCEVLLLIGSSINTYGLNCGYCGFDTCAEKQGMENVPCFFNANDMGIAIGSAVSVAADARVDNRVMYSVGEAARILNLLPNAKVILGIPLSATGKSPFFDRKA